MKKPYQIQITYRGTQYVIALPLKKPQCCWHCQQVSVVLLTRTPFGRRLVCVQCTASWSEEAYLHRQQLPPSDKPPEITLHQARYLDKLRNGYHIIDNPKQATKSPPYLIVGDGKQAAISIHTLKALVRMKVLDEQFNLTDLGHNYGGNLNEL